jgi:anaerobic magnesium-protoporphyrin IX monomethyl ester cyclase
MKPKIILYNPQSNSSGKKILPMSILALGAVLEGRHEYNIIDGNISQDPLRLLREQVRGGVNVIAVTVMPGPQLSQAYPHCVALKAEFPELIIVWGGYFPTLHASTCLKSPAVDYVIRGHGELVFLKLLDLLESNSDLSALKGLSYRDHVGAVIENPQADIPHPENLPPFPYQRIDVAQYVHRTFLGSRTLPHHSSYGCPFLCNFCAVASTVNGRWLAQSPERVAEIAELYVKRWKVNAIEFHDNNFFVDETRIAEIAERIAFLRLSWWGEARIDTLLQFSDGTWCSMRDSGLKMVFLGAESASAQTLHRMRKGGSMTPEKTIEAAAKMKHYGIIPEFSFVVGNPPDPESDVRETLGFIRLLKKVNPASEIILYNYTPIGLEGELYRAALENGFEFPATLEEWVSTNWMEFSSRRHSRAPWLKEGLRRRIRDFEQVLNAYYPTQTDERLTHCLRVFLRMASAWRYHTRLYDFPWELRMLQKLLHYRRPETTGF